MKTWAVSGDVLKISAGDEQFVANVDQVYASIVEKNPAWNDLPAGQCGDAADLKFSSYPVEFAIVMGTTQDRDRPCIIFEARTQHGQCFEVSGEALQCSHVVHEGTWYPGNVETAEAILSLLNEAEIKVESGQCNTLKGYLTLRKAIANGEPVIDRLPGHALKKLLPVQRKGVKPQGIIAELYPYQIDGWQWLRFLMREQLGGLLADEMGLGKTLQVIAALRDSGEERSFAGALVIAPGSLLENWIREIMKFCPDFKVLKHHGNMRAGSPADLEGFDVVVTSYDTVSRDLSLLRMILWNVAILDEAQYIRNPDALRTRSVKQIKRKSGVAVTGTPVENRLRDLWSIMDFVLPGYLGCLDAFESRYSESEEAAVLLEPLVSPLMLRRRVAEVASDLPERIDIPEILELNQPESEAYEKVRESVYEKYGAAATFVSLGKLRQFCAHPGIIKSEEAYLAHNEFTKFERLKELLDEIFTMGEKVLVFTSFTAMADRIATTVAEVFGVMAKTLDGRLSIPERQPMIDYFSTAEGPAVLVLNPRAGGTGLNITAANHVIHYNPEWNPAVEDQASARAYRRGQECPVTVRQLILSGTVEEVMSERLQRKRKLAEAAIIGVEGQDEDYADIVTALKRSPFSKTADQSWVNK